MNPHEATTFIETEWFRVPILSVVSAGKSNMEDLLIEGWRLIRASDKVRSTDTLCCAPVQGESLIGDGINDGDYVVVRLNFDVAEVTPGRLAAVWTPSGLLIKHVYVTLNDQVRLVSSNPRYIDLIFDGADVEIQGLIVRVERDM
jgi:SOS-response transcriptional repressor LexA